MRTKIPLGGRPELINCGLGEHGLHGREEYLLPKLWCLHLYFYKLRIEIQGISYDLVPGTVTLIPPGQRVTYHYTGRRCRHFYVHFALKGRDSMVELPLLQHLPDARDEMLDRLQNMQRVFTGHPLHAEVLLWGLLFDIAETGNAQSDGMRTPLIKAIDEFIEQRLPGKVTVEDIARAMSYNATHINRLVKKHHGCTTVQLLKRYRLRRAYRLLLHSTMPIKLVAAECGIPDLHQFNKLMHLEYGRSPRGLREAHFQEGASQTWAIERE